MKKIAVIIAAYDCAEYIMECVESVRSQRDVPKNWQLDLRLGVDGCTVTAAKLKQNKIPYYWTPRNVGAYVMRNSLIYLSPADVYSYFDADDKMDGDYLHETLFCFECKKAQAVICAKIQCDEKLNSLNKPAVIESGGAFSFSDKVLKKLGGYYRHRCAGDTDFMERTQMAGFDIVGIKEPLYLRRRHSKSLTKSDPTKYGSGYRKHAWSFMCKQRKKGIIKIKPTIIKLEEIK